MSAAPPLIALHHVSRQLNVLRYERLVFVLAEKLETDVSFEELFIIRCEALDLTVWGPTLTEAEEALAFAFYSLYENYYREADANLAPDALRLKSLLHTLILEIVQV